MSRNFKKGLFWNSLDFIWNSGWCPHAIAMLSGWPRSLPPPCVCPQESWLVTLRLTFSGHSRHRQLAAVGVMNQMSLHAMKSHHSNFSVPTTVLWKVYSQGCPTKVTFTVLWGHPPQRQGRFCVMRADSGARLLGFKHWLPHILVIWRVVCPLCVSVQWRFYGSPLQGSCEDNMT